MGRAGGGQGSPEEAWEEDGGAASWEAAAEEEEELAVTAEAWVRVRSDDRRCCAHRTAASLSHGLALTR